MLTHNLGYPRMGSHRELKKACEHHWQSGGFDGTPSLARQILGSRPLAPLTEVP